MGDQRPSALAYLLLRTAKAARGTLSGAFNLGPIIGAGALGGISALLRWPMIFPDTYLGVVASAVTYTVIAWCAVFIWRFVFITPYDMHVEEVAKSKTLSDSLSQLESSAEPCLSFAKSLSPSERYPRPTDARLHRIAIQNTSETRALHNVEVSISVSQSDGSSKTTARPVKDSDGQSAWDLNPGGAKQIDLLATKPDKEPPRVYFAPYFPDLSPRSANDGTYNVLLEATCRETRKVEGQFTLTLTGSGELHWQEVA